MTRRTRIASLTDQQLLDALRPLPWERRIGNFAFSGWGLSVVGLLAAGFVLYACVRMYNPPGLGPGLIFCCAVTAVLAAVTLFVIAYVALAASLEIRPAAYRGELGARYGSGLSRREQIEVAAELARPGGPTWVATLSWRALPHGGSHRVQIRVGGSGPARLEVRSMKEDRSGRSADERPPKLCRGTTELSAVEQSQLVDLLRAQSPGETSWGSTVRDGSPGSLVTLRRPPGEPSSLRCNFSDASQLHPDHPDVRLAGWLFATAERHRVRGA